MIGVPGIGAFTSEGLYAAVDAVRESRNPLPIIAEDPRFAAAAAGYCLFLVLFPTWGLFFRAKKMVCFSTQMQEVVFGRFWHYKKRFEKKRFAFGSIQEIEILHTKQRYARGGSGLPGAEPAMKEKYFLSVISYQSDEPAYIIRLPDPEPLTKQIKTITLECGLPFTQETFP